MNSKKLDGDILVQDLIDSGKIIPREKDDKIDEAFKGVRQNEKAVDVDKLREKIIFLRENGIDTDVTIV